jgi:DNA-binding IclR family transcriptional regulator
MKTATEKRLQVLSILFDNLSNPQPQLVGIEKIAGKLELPLKETRQLLLKMDQIGEIQSDLDGTYSLITPAGLDSLKTARKQFTA